MNNRHKVTASIFIVLFATMITISIVLFATMITSAKVGYAEGEGNIAKYEDVAFSAFGWTVTGRWSNGASEMNITCEPKPDSVNAVLSFTFPKMGRDAVSRFRLSSEKKSNRFVYIPPFVDGINTNNIYRIDVCLKSGGNIHRESISLAGNSATLKQMGMPLHSSKIKASIIGVNVHFTYAPENKGPCARWHKHKELTDMIAAAGIKWIRDWASTEKGSDGEMRIKPFILDWMRYAKSQGIEIICLVGMKPNQTVEECAENCRIIAEQTKGLVHVFELGNEPGNFGWRKKDNGPWNGKEPDNSTSPWVKKYAKYTNAGADAIKKVRPDATVIGLGDVPCVNFRFLDIGITNALDGVADHPYTYSMPPERVPYSWGQEKRDGIRTGDKEGTFLGLMNSYLDKFRETGKMHSLWLTEFGWPSFWFNGKNEKGLYAGFTEEAQAIYLVRRFIQCMTMPEIKVACQYDFLDDYNSKQFNAEANFGLIRTDYSPKPAYYAVQRLTSLFNGYKHDAKTEVIVEKAPLHRSMKRSELIHNWDDVTIMAANGICAYGFSNTNKPNERMVAIWSKLPVSREFNNRFTSIRIKGWKRFDRHPVAVDLMTGKSFDVPVKVEGEDLVFDLLLTDNPMVLKLFK